MPHIVCAIHYVIHSIDVKRKMQPGTGESSAGGAAIATE
jgi:hypothetical protein